MYKKILVPLDGSKVAECALPHAESLAHAYNSTLLLVTVVQPPKIIGRTSVEIEAFRKAMDAQRDEAESYLKGWKGELKKRNINVEIYIGTESVVSEIIETAENHEVDLVLIASHGRSGLERVFFGSVASGVLNRIERPLMVIHPSGR
jgi:nucleotide-binding universal stress UspA family protein